MKRFYDDFWKKLTEDQQDKVAAFCLFLFLLLIWISMIFTGTPLV